MNIIFRSLAMGMLVCIISCTKSDLINPRKSIVAESSASPVTEYIIPKGKQYCKPMPYTLSDLDSLCFVAEFDSTAIYTTHDPENQADINKLYGFSDNNAGHHLYSARFGWRWYDHSLQLFAYIYNNGVRSWRKLADIAIGEKVKCCIKVSGSHYIFEVNVKQTILPRASTTATARGYLLYPYFGGNETAPHDVHIWIERGGISGKKHL